MGAREKLNKGHLLGSLFLAALTGWLTQSFPVFMFALLVLLAVGLHSGDIRPSRRDRWR